MKRRLSDFKLIILVLALMAGFAVKGSRAHAAETAISSAKAVLGQNIVTQVLDIAPFYRAEDYHQEYYKGTNLVITRFGVITQADAYKRYRDGCGRDQRVRQLWGNQAPFVGG
ncbi:MAG: peptide-methionine (S)-S-oxide reductase [Rhodobacterales bacterium]